MVLSFIRRRLYDPGVILLMLLLALTPDDAQRDAVARALLTDFTAGRFDAAAKNFNDTLLAALPPAKLKEFAGQLAAQAGKFEKVREVQHGTEQGYRVVTLVSDYEKLRLDVRVAFDGDGKVAGLFFQPSGAAKPTAASTRFADYVTKSPLRLPFDGEWFVFWGGRTLGENYHAITVDQHFAYDLVMVRDGVSHPAGAKTNADYYCWNAAIVAPAAGTVVTSVDGIEDNVPGVMNRSAPPGNYIVIDHGNGEYSLLAHFRRGTVAVKTGDSVKAGDLLGRCGNSGNSSEPHLHYHLQNGPKFGGAEGLPAQFRDYCADGKPVAVGEPKKGQRIGPCRTAAAKPPL
jgi:murein DD-endopeptidase MepM/ murein hydrolase activator NlpD